MTMGSATGRTLLSRQVVILLLLFGGYAACYFGRANFSVTMPLLVDELVRRGLTPEDALVRLNSAAERLPEARKAVSGYRTNFLAVQALYQAGLGNLIDVETARRNVLSAEMAAKDIEQEQVSAWIALYRAAGGSWESNEEPKKPDYINHQVDFTREKS